ncbi:hypothetical protein Bbelb_239290 [Branchiostoma belcheri]|nr:hypothetical protein Bbelb_239290 [Branchiostoma belcheri]
MENGMLGKNRNQLPCVVDQDGAYLTRAEDVAEYFNHFFTQKVDSLRKKAKVIPLPKSTSARLSGPNARPINVRQPFGNNIIRRPEYTRSRDVPGHFVLTFVDLWVLRLHYPGVSVENGQIILQETFDLGTGNGRFIVASNSNETVVGLYWPEWDNMSSTNRELAEHSRMPACVKFSILGRATKSRVKRSMRYPCLAEIDTEVVRYTGMCYMVLVGLFGPVLLAPWGYWGHNGQPGYQDTCGNCPVQVAHTSTASHSTLPAHHSTLQFQHTCGNCPVQYTQYFQHTCGNCPVQYTQYFQHTCGNCPVQENYPVQDAYAIRQSKKTTHKCNVSWGRCTVRNRQTAGRGQIVFLSGALRENRWEFDGRFAPRSFRPQDVSPPNSFMTTHQHGFKKHYSTCTALLEMVDDWYRNIDCGNLKIMDRRSSEIPVDELPTSQTEQTDGPVVKGTVDKRYKCDQCDYSASRKGRLDSHMAKHTGDKPYVCGECGYRTVHNSYLTVHMRKHTGEKPYKCDLCDYSASQKVQLDRHMAQHTGDKPYMCGECGYRTADRSSLTKHMRNHTREKPYKYDQCDYSAAQKVSLDKHMAKDTGDKPYMCGECGFRTADRSNLTVHMRRHTGEKPYKCDQCNYSAAEKGDLDKHMAKHTGDKP